MFDVTTEQIFNLLKVVKDFIKIIITQNTTFYKGSSVSNCPSSIIGLWLPALSLLL